MQNENPFAYEEKIDQASALYIRGKKLNEEIDSLDPNDTQAADDFFIRLIDFDREAIKHYDDVIARQQAVIPEVPKVESSPKPISSSVDDSPRLSELVEKYIAEVRRGWGEKSADKTEFGDIRPKLAMFIRIVGDVPSKLLGRSDVSRFKETMFKMPSNVGKRLAYKHKTIDELVEMKIPKRHLMADTTLKDYFTKTGTFVRWMANNGFAEQGLEMPLQKVIKRKKLESEERQVFSDTDLVRLFNSKEYMQSTHKHPSRHWVVLLGLFTGARQNELCQLYKSDIYEQDDIWVIDINEADVKKVKNLNSPRLVPIHKTLIQLGFLDYVKSVKSKQLFPELTPSAKEGHARLLSKWFNTTYRKNCRVGLLVNEKKDFHSFRHTVINFYKQKGNVPESAVAELVGQKASGSVTFGRYGKAHNLETKDKLIQQLKFPAIDFKKIRRWKNIVILDAKREQNTK